MVVESMVVTHHIQWLISLVEEEWMNVHHPAREFADMCGMSPAPSTFWAKIVCVSYEEVGEGQGLNRLSNKS
jgi:hypothetical protein